MSSQPCGCDPEAKWTCEQHKRDLTTRMGEMFETPKQELERPTNPRSQSLPRLSMPAPAETIHTDPVTGGQKGRKLARFSLLPWDALWLVAEHFGKGAKKYADRNWELGYNWSDNHDAIHRHLALWWHGETYGKDDKFGQFRHIVAVAWHALVLVAFEIRGAGTDDRPKKVNIQEGQ